jgi:hypothetical protein
MEQNVLLIMKLNVFENFLELIIDFEIMLKDHLLLFIKWYQNHKC